MANYFKKLLLTAVFAILVGLPAFAQPLHTVKGKVVDEFNEGVPGAAVLVKGGTRGVMTDIDGRFSIEVSDQDILVVSFLGYEDEEYKPGKETQITIKIAPLENELDDAVIVAYGTQRKASVIGAISTISSEALASPVGNLSTSLAGKLAGIVSMQRSGEPGTSAEFWIRGVNTFGAGNSPLILVDGIERSMDLVDVEDIASFSILKDATATALYGVRGANGIVLITTRRGSESKPKVSFKSEYGVTQPVKIPRLANTKQWIDYYNELFIDSGSAPAIDEYEEQMYLSGADPDLYPSVDWMTTIFKPMANTARANLNVTGGTKSVRYYVGAAYYNEGGIFNVESNENYDNRDNQIKYTKYSFRSNVDINITQSTILALSLSTQYDTKNQPATSTSDIYPYAMYTTPVATPTIYSDGTLAWPDKGRNPYAMLNFTGYSRNANMNAQSLLSLTQDFSDLITEGLSANIKFAWDAYNGNTLSRNLNSTYYYATGRDDEGNLKYSAYNDGTNYVTLSRANYSSTTINLEAGLNYERLFNYAHRVSGMFLFTMRNRTNNVPGSYIAAFPYRNMGIAGRATYSYKDRYFGEFNFGYNGSENFAPGHRFGFFPSFAVGYMISNEPWWENIKEYVDLLKFKTSYGKIGNDQIGGSRRFAYNTTMNTSAGGFTFGTNGGTYVTGITTGDYGNEAVSWEEATKFDAGFELSLFEHFKFSADYFYDYRNGIFIQRESTPSIVGINVEQYVNLGRMKNQGVDMTAEYDHTFANGLNISARGNFTFNRNKKLYDDKPSQIYEYQNLVGYPFNQQFGLIAVGLFESQDDIDNWADQTFGSVRPGDIKYLDINGDGKVDAYDKVAIGYTTIPEINYGFGVSARWHGFDVSVFFQGVNHVTRIIGGQNLFGASEQIIKLGQIFADVAENRWTLANQNPNAPYPRLAMNKIENNQQASTYWQRDMSFIRLKNAEIGYTLPKTLTKKIGLSTARIYAQGVNLLTFSPFKLWDPELSASYGNQYPTMRTVTFGINLNF